MHANQPHPPYFTLLKLSFDNNKIIAHIWEQYCELQCVLQLSTLTSLQLILEYYMTFVILLNLCNVFFIIK
jgi:hypothetical protein